MSNQVNVIAALSVQDGKLAEVKEALAELAIETCKEPGNIEYIVMEDLTQPNTVFSIEKWENAEVEAKHWDMPYLKSAFGKIEGFLASEPFVRKGHQIS